MECSVLAGFYISPKDADENSLWLKVKYCELFVWISFRWSDWIEISRRQDILYELHSLVFIYILHFLFENSENKKNKNKTIYLFTLEIFI